MALDDIVLLILFILVGLGWTVGMAIMAADRWDFWNS